MQYAYLSVTCRQNKNYTDIYVTALTWHTVVKTSEATKQTKDKTTTTQNTQKRKRKNKNRRRREDGEKADN